MDKDMSQEAEGRLSPFLAEQRYKHAAKFIEQDDTVLDLGCGSGLLRNYIPETVRYYGLDSEKQWTGDPEYLFKVEVGGELPKELKKVKFSVVTALALIEHLSRPSELFSDVDKVLPSGGRFILTTPHPRGETVHALGAKLGIFSGHANEEHEELLGKERLQALAEQQGFKMTEYHQFLGGMNQVVVFVKT